MNKKGLTLSIVFEAKSLNYGEGIGNISELKKVTRGNGDVHTFASRQALGYDIRRLGREYFDWKETKVEAKGSGNKKTIQYAEDIEESEEMDLFGFMKTNSGSQSNTRPAPVRLSPATSLEPYKSDMDFLSNKGLADREDENSNLANVEEHKSFYSYTLTLDLSKIGLDKKAEIELDQEEKNKRVQELLKVIKLLNRDIRGREENLNPLFVIGGIYSIPNPHFLNKIKLKGEKGFEIAVESLEDTLEMTLLEEEIADSTNLGLTRNTFNNEEEIKSILPDEQVLSVEEFFENLSNQVEEFYLG